jgi:hypothetical protein
VPLGRLQSALSLRQIYPVDIIYAPALPKEARSPAANAVFEKIKPALEELLAPGFDELARRKMWPEISRLAVKIGVPPATLNLAFTKVLQAGGIIEAAVPGWHKCGRKQSAGKKDYTPHPTNQPDSYHLRSQDFDYIAAGVRKFLRAEATWKEAHDKFLEVYYPESEKIIGDQKIVTTRPPGQRPSLFQFKVHGMKLVPLQERLTQQFGDRIVQTDHRGRPNGQSGPAIYPGVVSEIDWTLSDIVGVARGSRLSVGRMAFYAIADVQSGLMTAAYLTMASGKAYEAGRAIVQCLEDKVELCARFGLVITREMWDVQALPQELRCDRGEIDSWKSTGIGTALGIKLEYCPSKRPDLKGTIESFFRVVRYFLRRLRGGTSGHRERLKDHSNVTAIYDFDQVQKLLLALAIAYNKRVRRRQAMTPGMVAAHTLPVPNELYRWAKERGCIREFSLEAAQIGTLPTHFSNVTMEGIKVMGLRFMVPEFEPSTTDGIDPNDWLMRAKKGSWKVEIGIDPATVDFVWLRHRPADGPVVALKCLLSGEHSGWQGLSWVEYGLNNDEYKAAITRYQETELRDSRAWLRAVSAQTTTEALATTVPARAGMSASAQIAGAAERREQEMNGNGEPDAPSSTTGGEFFDEKQWGKN